MEVTRLIAFRGPAALAFALVRLLEAEGSAVQWNPPDGDPAAAFTAVTARLTVTGPPDAITAAIARFRARARHAQVTVEGDDDDPGPVAQSAP